MTYEEAIKKKQEVWDAMQRDDTKVVKDYYLCLKELNEAIKSQTLSVGKPKK